jgi:hypothetical protein
MSKNPFAALQMDSDSESEKQKNQVKPSPVLRIQTPTQSPSFRVWKLEEGEEKPKNVFKSPFSQKKRKPKQEQTDTEGWVSIQKNQPNFVDDNASTESEKEIRKEVIMEALMLEPVSPPDFEEKGDFNSMLSRGTGTSLTALDWAERVRTSLEKAEQARIKPPSAAQKTEDFINGLGRLSFFRRPLTNDE